jgi:hypothetical protein
LREIFCLRRITEHPQADAEHETMVPVVQRLECADVTVSNPLHQPAPRVHLAGLRAAVVVTSG